MSQFFPSSAILSNHSETLPICPVFEWKNTWLSSFFSNSEAGCTTFQNPNHYTLWLITTTQNLEYSYIKIPRYYLNSLSVWKDCSMYLKRIYKWKNKTFLKNSSYFILSIWTLAFSLRSAKNFFLDMSWWLWPIFAIRANSFWRNSALNFWRMLKGPGLNFSVLHISVI